MTTLLTIDDLAVERGGLSLFEHLSLKVSAGDLIQLVGPNGCGKTTLLRLLAGLSFSSQGSIDHRHKGLLYLGHRCGLKARLTPLENLRWYFPAASKDALLSALQTWQMEGYENIPCQQLSAGQLQRVALSRLLLSDADLWLLDEPFTSIDKQGVVQLERCLGDAAKNNTAIIFTSHHLVSGALKIQQLNLESFAS